MNCHSENVVIVGKAFLFVKHVWKIYDFGYAVGYDLLNQIFTVFLRERHI